MLASTYPSKQNIDNKHSTELTERERRYVLLTQQGLPIIAQPYHWLANELKMPVSDVLLMTNDLLKRGIIRRIAAVPNHYKLGYCYNGMTVWDIEDSQASVFGDAVGKLPFVSHCYLRPRHMPDWNYNLFAMVHGKSHQEIDLYRQQLKELLKDVLNTRSIKLNLKSSDMLISTKILKKTGLRLKNKAINQGV
ncbi:MAG: DNA-binding Lrp family transcriptional regulator [Alteromonadaceae bacterium]|jgi:DNA-binding Lrp family transcriptional regulator